MADVRPKADSHPLLATSRARAFIDRSDGGGGGGVSTCRNSTVSSDSRLQLGGLHHLHQWSDQHHLGCFRYS